MIWRPASRDDRRLAGLWAACVGIGVLLRPLWLVGAAVVPFCPWRALTGWPCPGCGSTRAIVRLLHADIPGAMRFNPLAACGVAAFALGGIAAPLWLACGAKVPVFASRTRPAWLAVLAAAGLANWVWLVAAGV